MPACDRPAWNGPDPRRSREGLPRPGPPPPVVRPFGTSVVVLKEPTPPSRNRWKQWLLRRETGSFLVSFVFHLALLVVLAWFAETTLPGTPSGAVALRAVFEEPEDVELTAGPLVRLPDRNRFEGDMAAIDPSYRVPEVAAPGRNLSQKDHAHRDARFTPSRDTPWLRANDADVRGALEGRNPGSRAAAVGRGGATRESERAVERGLRWIMAQQREDGSWSFKLEGGSCRGRCANPGTETTLTGATAMAILPFLGAGYTHREGPYAEVLNRGLYYLVQKALITPNGADLQSGTMYSQGLSTIALCEAYAMTRDPMLKELAQKSIDFVVFAQDKKGGGWRYTPGEPGDITVTGWQLMALKSGQMARLNVPSPTIFLAQRFLDSVGTDGGARYGYMTPQPRKTTSAVGLLCRMYTGWPREEPGLRRGVALLSQWKPSLDNMYYNYYATQVLHHWQGPAWETWNRSMRDYLVKTQAAERLEAGSWHFDGGHGDTGGRLYNTAMAIMTLEVYYRYMPLYDPKAFEAQR